MSAHNIIVAIRVRPLSVYEKSKGQAKTTELNINSDSITISEKKAKSKTFTFDHCYDGLVGQQKIYEDIGIPALSHSLDGYDSTIFAYGQAGSGKTFSIMGDEGNPGLVPRLGKDLFGKIDERLQQAKESGSHIDYLVSISFLEICDEKINDLLNPSSKQLKMNGDYKEGFFVEGLCEIIVRNNDEMMSLIEQGNNIRRITATKIIEQSLCSHACLIMKIEKKTTLKSDGVNRVALVESKLNLVDLGGFEKSGTKSDKLRVGMNDVSLMALRNVINALAEGVDTKKNTGENIPYKDSELTKLLRKSLGGNTRTTMIATLSPTICDYDKSKNVLKCVNRAKSIENTLIKNEEKS